MENSGIVFRWLPTNQKEIRNHRLNKGRTPNLQAHINKMHLDYIATRPGAALNKNAHGIFGYIYNPEENKLKDCDELSLKSISERVENMSKQGIDVFKTVISLKEDDAITYGYTNRTSWKGLIEGKINEIAREYKIPIGDLEWTASYHTESGHLHCHLLFWDRNQNCENKKNKRMPFVRYKQIRKSLAKEVFRNDYMLAVENKNESRIKFLKISESEIDNLLAEVMPEQIPRNTVFSNKINKNNLEGLTSKISNLEEFIKQENLKNLNTEKINYRYGFQQKTVKEYIDKISFLILKSSPDCKIAFKKYIKDCIEVQKIIGAIENDKDENNIKMLAEKELLNKMGNIILKNIKDIRIEEKAKQRELKQKQYEENYIKYLDQRLENQILYNKLSINNASTMNIVEQIFKELSNMSISNNAKLSRIQKDYSNLSKAEKRELAKQKLNSNGFEWFDD